MAGQTLVRAEYLIADPSRGATGTIRDAALVIDGNTIAAVGPWSELEPRYRHLTPLGGPDGWLAIPGLVNAHHHGRGVSTLCVGMADAPLELWLPEFILYRGYDVHANTLYAATRMLRSGITTSIESHLGAGPLPTFCDGVEASLRAYRDAGARVAFAVGCYEQQEVTYLNAEGWLARLPETLRQEVRARLDYARIRLTVDEYLEAFERCHARCATEFPLARVMLNPRGLQWASEAFLRRVAETAARHQAGIHTHLLETLYQRTYAERRFNASAVDVLERSGLLGPRTSVAHAVWVTGRDVERLAATQTTVVTNASSNLRLGSGVVPLNALRARGVNVAVGLDSATLFDDDDMLKEMRLVATLHRRGALGETWLSPYAALAMATVGGARAALLEGQIGRLLPGYRADLTILDMTRVREGYVDPRADLPALALARAQTADVDMVIVDGEVLLRGGRFTRLDERQVAAALRESWQAHEAERNGEAAEFLTKLRPHLVAAYEGWESSAYDPYVSINSRT